MDYTNLDAFLKELDARQRRQEEMDIAEYLAEHDFDCEIETPLDFND